ncbi:MAG TPA: aminotransferase class V-fold PLP-dependent enzyme, partial [Microbacterium sp.]|nr:aminotransferase class V-fold PLP-dependent enzyme [Microbacterium sp.]
MRHYLDHAATTPLRPESRDAWVQATTVIGNASSTHGAGQDARRLLEESRERIAAVLGSDPIEVVLTSGGTESINTALRGLWASRPQGTDAIVLPDAEHHATVDTIAALAREGASIRRAGVTDLARIDPRSFADALPGAALATALVANNESGTINDAAALSQAAGAALVPLHLDAVAALGHVPLSFRGLRGDAQAGSGLVAMSIAGHKIGAPVGIGALVVART